MAKRLAQLERLGARRRELSRQLGEVSGRSIRDDPWVSPGEVRRALSADTVLVDFARFDLCDFQAGSGDERWKPPHYAAWVIPPAGQGEIRLIDLGEADAIEAAVASIRREIETGRNAQRGRNENEAEAHLNPLLQALAERVLQPLLPHIGATPRWILSPDAALWLIPWAALPVEQGRYAIEDHAIQLVVSGRELAHDVGVSSNGRGQGQRPLTC